MSLNTLQYHLLHLVLTLVTATFLFISFGVLCEFAMLLGVYILLPLRKKRYTLLSEGTDGHIQQHIHQKDLNLCIASILL